VNARRVDDALAIARLRFGDRGHVIADGRRFGFGDLDAAATRAAEVLRPLELVRGARVALVVDNSFAAIAAVLGIWRAGAALVPINPKNTPFEVETMCRLAAVRAVCGVRDGGLEIGETFAAASDPPDDELAAIAFTSGTTGQPKGVEITHSNLLWSATAVVHTRRDTHESVAAVLSPLCHLPIFVSHYLARLLSGGTVVIGGFDATSVADALRRHRITDLPLVPAMVGPLLAEPTIGEASSVRKVTVGSATTPMETKRRLAERFPGAEVIEAYGQTETTDGVTMTTGSEALDRPRTVGRAHATIAIAVMDADGRLVAPGTAGEIVCRGPTIMRGYHRDPEATAAAFRAGWLRTGDLGTMDVDGYLFITGRLKEIIISGGENVSPEEVEAAIAAHPAVVEAAVFGVPDERWGEAVAAAVVVREPVSEEDLTATVASRLARFKKPRRIFFVDSLPRTSAGKLKRVALRDALLAGGGER